MKTYQEMTLAERQAEYAALCRTHQEQKALGLDLNMARGKPGREQLDMVMEMYNIPLTADDFITDGIDARNYGYVAGIPIARRLFADLLGCKPGQVIAGGNSSLEMMFDAVSKAYTHGLLHSEKPWGKLDRVKWICPVPGYDRHFKVTESFGMELLSVPMTETGPDMDRVEQLIRDPEVRGMWNVPKYSNPTGITYSDETVRRFARLKPKAADFRIYWDNSYVLHDIGDTPDSLLNLYAEAEACGNEDIVFLFTSTSKITFPGAGVACVAASPKNIDWMLRRIQYQTIGPDKLNQLRHLRMLPDLAAVRAQMARHRAIIRPKFGMVLDAFEAELSGLPGVSWTRPNGGYFISLDLPDGCASRAVALAKEAGLVLTPAGATFPYGRDPKDANIRVAPTYPSLAELEKALDLMVCCVRLAVGK